MNTTTPNQRDIDIRIASSMDTYVKNEGDFFVLTGSYSIDALTGADVNHNDIDSNIFTTDIPVAMGRIATTLELHEPSMELIKKTDNRLEYLHPHQHGSTPVEMQFIQYDSISQRTDGSVDFALPSVSGHDVIVPAVEAGLSEANGYEHKFLVKTLPFAIATWALRVSGVALSQKRAVRESDVRHFAFLASMPHDRVETVEAMRHHPQMPSDCNAHEVLDKSYEIVMERDV